MRQTDSTDQQLEIDRGNHGEEQPTPLAIIEGTLASLDRYQKESWDKYRQDPITSEN